MQALSQLSYTPTANAKLYGPHRHLQIRRAAIPVQTDAAASIRLSSRPLRTFAFARPTIRDSHRAPSIRCPCPPRRAYADRPCRPRDPHHRRHRRPRPPARACLRARGATVVLHGRVVRKLEALYDEIVAAGDPQPTILPLDLATAGADDFGNVAGAIRAQLGRLDGDRAHGRRCWARSGRSSTRRSTRGSRCCASTWSPRWR